MKVVFHYFPASTIIAEKIHSETILPFTFAVPENFHNVPLPLISVSYTEGYGSKKSSEGKLVYFASIDSAKFRKPVRPGEILSLYIEKIRGRGTLWKFSGTAKGNGSVVSECIFSAMIVDAGK